MIVADMTYAEHKAKCIKDCGYKQSKVMDLIYAKAYEEGHAAGYYEVEARFDDLADWLVGVYQTANLRYNPDTMD